MMKTKAVVGLLSLGLVLGAGAAFAVRTAPPGTLGGKRQTGREQQGPRLLHPEAGYFTPLQRIIFCSSSEKTMANLTSGFAGT